MSAAALYEWSCRACQARCALMERRVPEAPGGRMILSCPDCGLPEGTTALVPPGIQWSCERAPRRE